VKRYTPDVTNAEEASGFKGLTVVFTARNRSADTVNKQAAHKQKIEINID